MNDVIYKSINDASINIPIDNILGVSWIDEFIKTHGRKPRVLHVGNIANNAYNNAKLLNKSGIDCDVICYDYYHIMACPEWEDSDFRGDPGDHFCPKWHSVELDGFSRQNWFAQGPVKLCIRYLINKSRGNKIRERIYWSVLSVARRFRCGVLDHVLRTIAKYVLGLLGSRRLRKKFKYTYVSLLKSRKLRAADKYTFGMLRFLSKGVVGLLLLPSLIARKCYGMLKCQPANYSKNNEADVFCFDKRVSEVIDEYNRIYVDRKDAITVDDFEQYRYIIPYWHALFSEYDIVQAYATDPLLLMLSGNVPYIGFEHGTLRDFTLCNKSICRLTTLGYKLANHVFITNGDCLEYAKKIKLDSYSAMLHPFDEHKIRSIQGGYQKLHEKYDVKYIFLCTLRHEWKIKGTDIYIRAIPDIIEKIGDDFVLLMTRWGTELDKSMELARELNVEKYIKWIEPLSRYELFRAHKSVDVLFDQIALPHFGATAPEGIASGVPVIMSYKPESTAWIVDEPAPILSAWNEIEVAEAVSMAIDKEWLSEYKEKANEWIDSHHSSKLIIDKHLTAYKNILGF